MAKMQVDEFEIGIRGRRITITGTAHPEGRTYQSEETLDFSLGQARSLYCLLGKFIPIAEKIGPAAAIHTITPEEEI